MTNISYAQNLEDIILYRSLNGVSSGFYIDVGANDPEKHSVTKKFYDLGWRGINIEPSKAYFEKLKQERPRDINLRAVVSYKDGFSRFFEIEGTGISTTEKDVSEFHRKSGYISVECKVRAITLASVCRKYVDGPVHFLKIDVEGGTKSVLEGMDLSAVRPWILVVEATKPGTQTEDFDEWEHFILSQEYEFVYADGLNRFYLAFEHFELRNNFKYPPNVFDGFVLSPELEQMALRRVGGADALDAAERAVTLEQENSRLLALVRTQNDWGQAAEAKIFDLTKEKNRLEGMQADHVALAQAAVRSRDAWGMAAEARMVLLEQEKADLEAALASHLVQVKAAASRIDALEQDNKELEAAVRTQDDRAQTAEARIALLERDKASFEILLDSRLVQIEAADARIAALEQEKASVEDALASRLVQLNTAETRAKGLKQEKVCVETELANRLAQLQAAEARAEGLELERAGVEAALASGLAQLQAAKACANGLEQEKAGIEAELASRLAQLQAAEARADGFKQETVALAEALAVQEARTATVELHLERESAALQASRDAYTQAAALAAQLAREKGDLELSWAHTSERLQAALQKGVELERLRRELQASLMEQIKRAREASERADHLEAMVRRVAGSLSWRITAPLRGWGKKGEGGRDANR